MAAYSPKFLTAYNNGGATPNTPDARKPLIFKAFRASFTLMAAGYVAPADAAALCDFPLRQRGAVSQAVAQRQNFPL